MSEILLAGKHCRAYTVLMHQHNTWEFVYCTSGNGRFVFEDGEEIRYNKNDIVVIPPFCRHYNTSDSGFANIFFAIDSISFPFNNSILVHDDDDRRILNVCNEMYLYANSDLIHKNILLSALGDLLVAYIVNLHNFTPYTPEVDVIKKEIIMNFADCSFRLDDTLNRLPISYDYLRKMFKQEIGVTPLEFLIDTRMKSACNLLRAKGINGHNVSEIAEMCGYDDPLYFSRMFKRRLGLSPSEYANKNLNTDS
ncbi:MAG: AraC family transcriptional regulator [Clostridia bacterium]|nr:AraC family transcriptional regulator [Clostridia bacterium]